MKMSKKLARSLLKTGPHELTHAGSWRKAVVMLGGDVFGNREQEPIAAIFGSILQAEARRVLEQKKVKK